ncbi:hypothetical protein E2C01_092039 [Portunus trituberculatus]|uniref:Uncharacterized protein n=1 Tax=Portunus trituberculatus TaxID=210409 RepID=A0A5B7JQP2_PORTR|nr:hypothetical protein [Portunus trituberculatus]
MERERGGRHGVGLRKECSVQRSQYPHTSAAMCLLPLPQVSPLTHLSVGPPHLPYSQAAFAKWSRGRENKWTI